MTRTILTLLALLLFGVSPCVHAQSSTYPKEIRGYKVERAIVEVKKPDSRKDTGEPQPREDDLIKFGDPTLVSATPLGITLEIPVVISPVRQKGEVDFLVFEEMVINGTSVQIEDYLRKFKLPGNESLTLKEPLKFYISLPSAVFAALGEWTSSKETWLVTGRVYVFGKFKKAIFNFKRCIPVELNLTMRNPLK